MPASRRMLEPSIIMVRPPSGTLLVTEAVPLIFTEPTPRLAEAPPPKLSISVTYILGLAPKAPASDVEPIPAPSFKVLINWVPKEPEPV